MDGPKRKKAWARFQTSARRKGEIRGKYARNMSIKGGNSFVFT